MERKTEFYKRSNFVTHLPVDYLYTPSHFWIEKRPEGVLRIGFTKFATRMLGEIVDHQFEKQQDEPVSAGEIIGSIEGFKALSDLYCAADGMFKQGNPELKTQIELVGEDPYGKGWLYEVEGTPDLRSIDLAGYRTLLDSTIERILAKQRAEEPAHE